MKNTYNSKKKDTNANINMEGFSNIIDNTSKIVVKAANILEEEIAKGIIAAKRMEEKYTDVDKLRSADKEELLVRFRKDAHDIIDLFIDFTSIAVRNVNKMSSQWISVKSETPDTDDKESGQNSNVPLIKVPKELKPGEIYKMPIKLENDNKTEQKSIFFENTSLSGNGEKNLPGNIISFDPNPLLLQPATTGMVTLTISVPHDALEGTYSCLIQAKDLNDLKAMLFLKIIKG